MPCLFQDRLQVWNQLFGELFQRDELFTHHDQISPGEQLEARSLPAVLGLVYEQPNDDTAIAGGASSHQVGQSDQPEQPFATGNERRVMCLFTAKSAISPISNR